MLKEARAQALSQMWYVRRNGLSKDRKTRIVFDSRSDGRGDVIEHWGLANVQRCEHTETSEDRVSHWQPSGRLLSACIFTISYIRAVSDIQRHFIMSSAVCFPLVASYIILMLNPEMMLREGGEACIAAGLSGF